MNADPSNSSGKPAPALSIILVTIGGYEIVHKAIQALCAQTVRDQLELVLLAPSREALGAMENGNAFHSVQLIEVGKIQTLAAARLAGIRAARAPLVALAEDHAFPEPGWAEALLEGHKQGWAGVGPVFLNANPGLLSWISVTMDYGRWLDPAAGGETDDIPGHNSAWKRALLLEYGADLERLLSAPTIMHWDLRSKGYTVWLEPAAKVRHVNVTRWQSFFFDHFHGARIFAAVRAHPWPWSRRLLYAAATPILTTRRISEWRGHIRRIGLEPELFPRGWPVLLASALVCGLGEMTGYLFGAGNAEERVLKYDAHRAGHVKRRERALLTTG
jgi:Glycosyl transferase family 2